MSNTSIFTKKYIKRTGLLKYIDYALFSFEIGVIKPDLKFFRIMRQKAKCRFNEMLMIGDKKGDDVIPARKLGIQAIHFKNYPQLKERLKKFSIFIN
jgi:FMN phosphatase YigB (HAD superfamily)